MYPETKQNKYWFGWWFSDRQKSINAFQIEYNCSKKKDSKTQAVSAARLNTHLYFDFKATILAPPGVGYMQNLFLL